MSLELREQFKRIARKETAFDLQAYDHAVQATGNPLAEHCGCVAYAVQRLFGGKVILARYTSQDGKALWHMWNWIPVKTPHGNTLVEFDLTKGQFGESEVDFAPPRLRLKYLGQQYENQSVSTYRWENEEVNPMRNEIIQFWTAFTTSNLLRHPQSNLSRTALSCELSFSMSR